MSFTEVFASSEARHREIVFRDTWGHLDAKPGTTFDGYILFALGVHGDIVLLDWDFEGVQPNPWIYEEMTEYIGKQVMKRNRSWGIWRFDGAYRVYKNGKAKFAGKVRPMRVTYRFAGKTR